MANLGSNASKVLIWVLCCRIFIALVNVGEYSNQDPNQERAGLDASDTCNNLAALITGGCGALLVTLVSFATGILLGAPWYVNVVLAGAQNIALIWAILQLIRGT